MSEPAVQITDENTAPRPGNGNLRPRWKKGQSGNPGGRPKGLASRVRELVGDDANAILEVFSQIATDPKAKVSDRIAAGRELLDRGWGKAPSFAPLEGNPLDNDPIYQFIAGELDELAAARSRKAGLSREGTQVAGAGEA